MGKKKVSASEQDVNSMMNMGLVPEAEPYVAPDIKVYENAKQGKLTITPVETKVEDVVRNKRLHKQEVDKSVVPDWVKPVENQQIAEQTKQAYENIAIDKAGLSKFNDKIAFGELLDYDDNTKSVKIKKDPEEIRMNLKAQMIDYLNKNPDYKRYLEKNPVSGTFMQGQVYGDTDTKWLKEGFEYLNSAIFGSDHNMSDDLSRVVNWYLKTNSTLDNLSKAYRAGHTDIKREDQSPSTIARNIGTGFFKNYSKTAVADFASSIIGQNSNYAEMFGNVVGGLLDPKAYGQKLINQYETDKARKEKGIYKLFTNPAEAFFSDDPTDRELIEKISPILQQGGKKGYDAFMEMNNPSQSQFWLNFLYGATDLATAMYAPKGNFSIAMKGMNNIQGKAKLLRDAGGDLAKYNKLKKGQALNNFSRQVDDITEEILTKGEYLKNGEVVKKLEDRGAVINKLWDMTFQGKSFKLDGIDIESAKDLYGSFGSSALKAGIASGVSALLTNPEMSVEEIKQSAVNMMGIDFANNIAFRPLAMIGKGLTFAKYLTKPDPGVASKIKGMYELAMGLGSFPSQAAYTVLNRTLAGQPMEWDREFAADMMFNMFFGFKNVHDTRQYRKAALESRQYAAETAKGDVFLADNPNFIKIEKQPIRVEPTKPKIETIPLQQTIQGKKGLRRTSEGRWEVNNEEYVFAPKTAADGLYAMMEAKVGAKDEYTLGDLLKTVPEYIDMTPEEQRVLSLLGDNLADKKIKRGTIDSPNTLWEQDGTIYVNNSEKSNMADPVTVFRSALHEGLHVAFAPKLDPKSEQYDAELYKTIDGIREETVGMVNRYLTKSDSELRRLGITPLNDHEYEMASYALFGGSYADMEVEGLPAETKLGRPVDEFLSMMYDTEGQGLRRFIQEVSLAEKGKTSFLQNWAEKVGIKMWGKEDGVNIQSRLEKIIEGNIGKVEDVAGGDMNMMPEYNAYQGYYFSIDNRKNNYFTTDKDEAFDYGPHVRQVQIDTDSFLIKSDTERYYNLVDQYYRQTGYRFDVLDSNESAKNGFYEFVEKQGYDGIDFLSGRDNPVDNKYIITFNDKHVKSVSSEAISNLDKIKQDELYEKSVSFVNDVEENTPELPSKVNEFAKDYNPESVASFFGFESAKLFWRAFSADPERFYNEVEKKVEADETIPKERKRKISLKYRQQMENMEEHATVFYNNPTKDADGKIKYNPHKVQVGGKINDINVPGIGLKMPYIITGIANAKTFAENSRYASDRAKKLLNWISEGKFVALNRDVEGNKLFDDVWTDPDFRKSLAEQGMFYIPFGNSGRTVLHIEGLANKKTKGLKNGILEGAREMATYQFLKWLNSEANGRLVDKFPALKDIDMKKFAEHKLGINPVGYAELFKNSVEAQQGQATFDGIFKTIEPLWTKYYTGIDGKLRETAIKNTWINELSEPNTWELLRQQISGVFHDMINGSMSAYSVKRSNNQAKQQKGVWKYGNSVKTTEPMYFTSGNRFLDYIGLRNEQGEVNEAALKDKLLKYDKETDRISSRVVHLDPLMAKLLGEALGIPNLFEKNRTDAAVLYTNDNLYKDMDDILGNHEAALHKFKYSEVSSNGNSYILKSGAYKFPKGELNPKLQKLLDGWGRSVNMVSFDTASKGNGTYRYEYRDMGDGLFIAVGSDGMPIVQDLETPEGVKGQYLAGTYVGGEFKATPEAGAMATQLTLEKLMKGEMPDYLGKDIQLAGGNPLIFHSTSKSPKRLEHNAIGLPSILKSHPNDPIWTQGNGPQAYAAYQEYFKNIALKSAKGIDAVTSVRGILEDMFDPNSLDYISDTLPVNTSKIAEGIEIMAKKISTLDEEGYNTPDWQTIYGNKGIADILQDMIITQEDETGTFKSVRKEALPFLYMLKEVFVGGTNYAAENAMIHNTVKSFVNNAINVRGRGAYLTIVPDLGRDVEGFVERNIRADKEFKNERRLALDRASILNRELEAGTLDLATYNEAMEKQRLALDEIIDGQQLREFFDPETGMLKDYSQGAIVGSDVAKRLGLKLGDKAFAILTPFDDIHCLVPITVAGFGDTKSTFTMNAKYLSEVLGRDYDKDAISIMVQSKEFPQFDVFWQHMTDIGIPKGVFKSELGNFLKLAEVQENGKSAMFNRLGLPNSAWVDKTRAVHLNEDLAQSNSIQTHLGQNDIAIRNNLASIFGSKYGMEDDGKTNVLIHEGKKNTTVFVLTYPEGKDIELSALIQYMVDTYDTFDFDPAKALVWMCMSQDESRDKIYTDPFYWNNLKKALSDHGWSDAKKAKDTDGFEDFAGAIDTRNLPPMEEADIPRTFAIHAVANTEYFKQSMSAKVPTSTKPADHIVDVSSVRVSYDESNQKIEFDPMTKGPSTLASHIVREVKREIGTKKKTATAPAIDRAALLAKIRAEQAQEQQAKKQFTVEDAIAEYGLEELSSFGLSSRTQQEKVRNGDPEAIKQAYNIKKAEEQYTAAKEEIARKKKELQKINEQHAKTKATDVGSVLTLYNDNDGSDFKAKVTSITKKGNYATVTMVNSKKKEYTMSFDKDGNTKSGWIAENFQWDAVDADRREEYRQQYNQLLEEVKSLEAASFRKDIHNYYKDYFAQEQGGEAPVEQPVATPKQKGLTSEQERTFLDDADYNSAAEEIADQAFENIAVAIKDKHPNLKELQTLIDDPSAILDLTAFSNAVHTSIIEGTDDWLNDQEGRQRFVKRYLPDLLSNVDTSYDNTIDVFSGTTKAEQENIANLAKAEKWDNYVFAEINQYFDEMVKQKELAISKYPAPTTERQQTEQFVMDNARQASNLSKMPDVALKGRAEGIAKRLQMEQAISQSQAAGDEFINEKLQSRADHLIGERIRDARGTITWHAEQMISAKAMSMEKDYNDKANQGKDWKSKAYTKTSYKVVIPRENEADQNSVGIANKAGGKLVMLARDAELGDLPLLDITKRSIDGAYRNGLEFAIDTTIASNKAIIEYLESKGIPYNNTQSASNVQGDGKTRVSLSVDMDKTKGTFKKNKEEYLLKTAKALKVMVDNDPELQNIIFSSSEDSWTSALANAGLPVESTTGGDYTLAKMPQATAEIARKTIFKYATTKLSDSIGNTLKNDLQQKLGEKNVANIEKRIGELAKTFAYYQLKSAKMPKTYTKDEQIVKGNETFDDIVFGTYFNYITNSRTFKGGFKYETNTTNIGEVIKGEQDITLKGVWNEFGEQRKTPEISVRGLFNADGTINTSLSKAKLLSGSEESGVIKVDGVPKGIIDLYNTELGQAEQNDLIAKTLVNVAKYMAKTANSRGKSVTPDELLLGLLTIPHNGENILSTDGRAGAIKDKQGLTVYDKTILAAIPDFKGKENLNKLHFGDPVALIARLKDEGYNLNYEGQTLGEHFKDAVMEIGEKYDTPIVVPNSYENANFMPEVKPSKRFKRMNANIKELGVTISQLEGMSEAEFNTFVETKLKDQATSILDWHKKINNDRVSPQDADAYSQHLSDTFNNFFRKFTAGNIEVVKKKILSDRQGRKSKHVTNSMNMLKTEMLISYFNAMKDFYRERKVSPYQYFKSIATSIAKSEGDHKLFEAWYREDIINNNTLYKDLYMADEELYSLPRISNGKADPSEVHKVLVMDQIHTLTQSQQGVFTMAKAVAKYVIPAKQHNIIREGMELSLDRWANRTIATTNFGITLGKLSNVDFYQDLLQLPKPTTPEEQLQHSILTEGLKGEINNILQTISVNSTYTPTRDIESTVQFGRVILAHGNDDYNDIAKEVSNAIMAKAIELGVKPSDFSAMNDKLKDIAIPVVQGIRFASEQSTRLAALAESMNGIARGLTGDVQTMVTNKAKELQQMADELNTVGQGFDIDSFAKTFRKLSLSTADKYRLLNAVADKRDLLKFRTDNNIDARVKLFNETLAQNEVMTADEAKKKYGPIKTIYGKMANWYKELAKRQNALPSVDSKEQMDWFAEELFRYANTDKMFKRVDKQGNAYFDEAMARKIAEFAAIDYTQYYQKLYKNYEWGYDLLQKSGHKEFELPIEQLIAEQNLGKYLDLMELASQKITYITDIVKDRLFQDANVSFLFGQDPQVYANAQERKQLLDGINLEGFLEALILNDKETTESAGLQDLVYDRDELGNYNIADKAYKRGIEGLKGKIDSAMKEASYTLDGALQMEYLKTPDDAVATQATLSALSETTGFDTIYNHILSEEDFKRSDVKAGTPVKFFAKGSSGDYETFVGLYVGRVMLDSSPLEQPYVVVDRNSGRVYVFDPSAVSRISIGKGVYGNKKSIETMGRHSNRILEIIKKSSFNNLSMKGKNEGDPDYAIKSSKLPTQEKHALTISIQDLQKDLGDSATSYLVKAMGGMYKAFIFSTYTGAGEIMTMLGTSAALMAGMDIPGAGISIGVAGLNFMRKALKTIYQNKTGGRYFTAANHPIVQPEITNIIRRLWKTYLQHPLFGVKTDVAEFGGIFSDGGAKQNNTGAIRGLAAVQRANKMRGQSQDVIANSYNDRLLDDYFNDMDKQVFSLSSRRMLEAEYINKGLKHKDIQKKLAEYDANRDAIISNNAEEAARKSELRKAGRGSEIGAIERDFYAKNKAMVENNIAIRDQMKATLAELNADRVAENTKRIAKGLEPLPMLAITIDANPSNPRLTITYGGEPVSAKEQVKVSWLDAALNLMTFNGGMMLMEAQATKEAFDMFSGYVDAQYQILAGDPTYTLPPQTHHNLTTKYTELGVGNYERVHGQIDIVSKFRDLYARFSHPKIVDTTTGAYRRWQMMRAFQALADTPEAKAMIKAGYMPMLETIIHSPKMQFATSIASGVMKSVFMKALTYQMSGSLIAGAYAAASDELDNILGTNDIVAAVTRAFLDFVINLSTESFQEDRQQAKSAAYAPYKGINRIARPTGFGNAMMYEGLMAAMYFTLQNATEDFKYNVLDTPERLINLRGSKTGGNRYNVDQIAVDRWAAEYLERMSTPIGGRLVIPFTKEYQKLMDRKEN